MSWFNSQDDIRGQISSLESDLRYLEREADDARNKCSRYFDEYKSLISNNNYNETSESRSLLNESNYWGNVNSNISSKINDLEYKIRDLEREL